MNTRQYIYDLDRKLFCLKWKLPQIIAVKMLNKSQTKQNLDDE